MNHDEAGIKKKVSEVVYPADLLAQSDLMMCSLSTWGAWFKCLLHMWKDGNHSISGTVPELARLWGCSEGEAEGVVEDATRYKPCDVTISHGVVTLTSRRLKRRIDKREGDAERKRKQRSHKPVSSENSLPSFSSSFSSSSSFTDLWNKWIRHRQEIRKPMTELALQMQVKKLETMGLDNAIKSIETSIENGWQGLFFVEAVKSGKGPSMYELDKQLTAKRDILSRSQRECDKPKRKILNAEIRELEEKVSNFKKG